MAGERKARAQYRGDRRLRQVVPAEGTNTTDPDVSPLYADLRGMPPAIFTVGTRDALLDNSLFMAPRWLGAGNIAELAIHPGACHGFISLPSKVRDEALARIDAFLNRYV